VAVRGYVAVRRKDRHPCGTDPGEWGFTGPAPELPG
jgi:hypothetical protein